VGCPPPAGRARSRRWDKLVDALSVRLTDAGSIPAASTSGSRPHRELHSQASSELATLVQRDLVIVNLKDTKLARMKVRPPGGSLFYDIPDTAMILSGREIRAIVAQHVRHLENYPHDFDPQAFLDEVD
jgi:hypothetical protein